LKILTDREIKMLIIDYADQISKAMAKGKDIELTNTSNGIAVKEVSKKRVR
jgi:hypothetical protein